MWIAEAAFDQHSPPTRQCSDQRRRLHVQPIRVFQAPSTRSVGVSDAVDTTILQHCIGPFMITSAGLPCLDLGHQQSNLPAVVRGACSKWHRLCSRLLATATAIVQQLTAKRLARQGQGRLRVLFMLRTISVPCVFAAAAARDGTVDC